MKAENHEYFRKVEIKESGQKSLSQNCLNKYVEKGSINESVINLCITSFGIGLLALPQKVQYISLVFIPVLILFCGIINYWTFTVLGDASRKLKVNKYEDIVLALFNQQFTYFFIFILCFGLLGVIILLQVILYKFIGGIINEIFNYGYINMEIFSKYSFWGIKKLDFLYVIH